MTFTNIHGYIHTPVHEIKTNEKEAINLNGRRKRNIRESV